MKCPYDVWHIVCLYVSVCVWLGEKSTASDAHMGLCIVSSSQFILCFAPHKENTLHPQPGLFISKKCALVIMQLSWPVEAHCTRCTTWYEIYWNKSHKLHWHAKLPINYLDTVLLKQTRPGDEKHKINLLLPYVVNFYRQLIPGINKTLILGQML